MLCFVISSRLLNIGASLLIVHPALCGRLLLAPVGAALTDVSFAAETADYCFILNNLRAEWAYPMVARPASAVFPHLLRIVDTKRMDERDRKE